MLHRTLVVLFAGVAASVSVAQCPWDVAFARGGADVFEGLFEPEARAILEAESALGRVVYVGGLFTQLAGQDVLTIGAWDGTSWSAVGGGLEVVGPPRFENPPFVNDMAFYDDGFGPALYVVGNFNTADPFGVPIEANQIARWDSEGWSPVGGGLGPVGLFGVGSQPSVLEVFGGELYAGGFLRVDFGSPADSLARWDGSQWRDVGGAFLIGAEPFIGRTAAMVVWNGSLYVGGEFDRAPGEVAANFVARWDGAQWHALGAGLDGPALSLAVYDDGTGEALYVGGTFANAGGQPAANIARWDGDAWGALGAGVEIVENGGVYALQAFDGALYAGGAFDRAGGIDSPNLARWEGSAWAAVDGPISGTPAVPWILPSVRSMAPSTLGGGGLLVGGYFDEVAPGLRAGSLARLVCVSCPADIDGDGELTIFDFLAFQNLFAVGDLRADFDGDGSLTLFDFLEFQNAFAQGCE